MKFSRIAGYPALCGRRVTTKAVRLAVVVDHPSEPGPYVIKVKAPSGTRLMPHRHPEDRIYTVMSGVFCIGLGEAFDGNRVQAFPPGSVIILPGGNAGKVCQSMSSGRIALKAAWSG